MSSPADLPGRTSHSQNLNDLQNRVQRESSSFCGTSSLLKNFLTAGSNKLRSLPHRYLRHGFIALSIPAALIAGSVLPAARQTSLTITPVAASYAVQATLSAFSGDAAVADAATTDEFVFTGATASLGAPVNTMYAPVAVEVANLRNGPSTSYARIGTLKQGQTVRLLGRSGDWFKVETKAGATGWVHSELVDVSSQVSDSLVSIKATTSAPAAAPVRVGVTTDDKVNLRSGPGTAHNVLAQLPSGAKLEVLGQQDGWFKVATSKGTVGWVTDDFFKIGGGAPAAAKASGPITASVSASSVNLRQGPSTRYGSFGRMKAGTALTVIARNGEWFKVRSPRGTVGWVAQDLVNISADLVKNIPITKDIPPAPKPVQNVTRPQPAAPTIAAAGGAAQIALQFVGARYIYGGSSPRGFDCSGLTSYVYRQLGVNLPHKASAQFSERYGQRVSMGNLAPGDLVFFANTAGRGITHVALYVGNGMMVSANTPRTGVQYVSLYGQYWQSHFAGGLRVYH
jgi:cell wall-associated NlpC family hydrolase